MSNDVFQIDFKKRELSPRVLMIGFALTAIGVIGAVAAYWIDARHAAYANIIAFTFLASIGVGGLFLVALEYISGAVWSTPVRRISEFFGAVLFVAVLAGLPVIFDMHAAFEWTHAEVVKADHLLSHKSPYLNEAFFIIRYAAIFAIWIGFYFFMTANSRKQDATRDQRLTRRNIVAAAIFIPLFAVTITVLSVDWMMSLSPHWFSTIFGVYYFSGTMLAALAAATFAVVKLDEHGYFGNVLRSDHYYSMGALMFAFTNFWAYIAFSQYLLIWYANLPEETVWMLARWQGNWKFIAVGLIIVHFIVPYIGLLSQQSKMDRKRLKFMALWMLFAHLYDLYFLIMPNFADGIVFGWIEVAFVCLALGLATVVFVWQYRRHMPIPIGDPKLKRGIEFRL